LETLKGLDLEFPKLAKEEKDKLEAAKMELNDDFVFEIYTDLKMITPIEEKAFKI